jgi:hypothetical protein
MIQSSSYEGKHLHDQFLSFRNSEMNVRYYSQAEIAALNKIRYSSVLQCPAISKKD